MNSSAASVMTLGSAVLPIVLPGEADLAVVELNQATVDDGDAVSAATEIPEHLLGSGERRLGEDDPVGLGHRVEPSGEGGTVGEARKRAGEAKFVGGENGAQLIQEQVAEMTGKHAHREEEAWFAGRLPTTARSKPYTPSVSTSTRPVVRPPAATDPHQGEQLQ